MTEERKIAVVASNGRTGQLIVREAVERGFDVTGFARSANKSVAQHFVQKDIMDITAEDLAGFEAVVDAFGAWAPETLPLHTTTSQHLADALSGTDTRLLIVGGAGSLYVDPEHTTQLYQTPDFPEAYVPTASAQADELAELRKRDDVRWTFVSPAGDFQADGKRTGSYILAGEELTLNDRGESVISYADYAIAMVDEVEKGDHVRQRISVVRK
ncbi:SDR family oxidoreductase [Parafannyhessea umbonata]|uniref:SDR family oxidoreductase n=1 Tax=Parafannyhessea umbonata TaxID=604330 RepID=UPI00359C7ADB